MKKTLFFCTILLTNNVFSAVNLGEKLVGVWSADCANSELPRTYRTSSLLGGYESVIKKSNGDIFSKSKYKVQTITESKFKINSIGSTMNGATVLRTNQSESIAEFLQDGRGINYSKFKTIDSTTTLENGEKIQFIKSGVVYKIQADKSLIANGDAQTIERCLI